MKATFVCPIENNSPVWPSHFDQSGNLAVSSVSCVGQVPQAPSVIGLIETPTDADMVVLKADARFLWIEDIEEVMP